MTRPPILVSGPTGSGKTTVSIAISKATGYRIVNVGDILRAQLRRVPSSRSDIGPAFLDAFGFDGYIHIMKRLVRDGHVVDGVRSVTAIRFLRIARNDMFTVHCLSDPAKRINDNFSDWVQPIQYLADEILPWVPGSLGVNRKVAMAVERLALHRVLGSSTHHAPLSQTTIPA